MKTFVVLGIALIILGSVGLIYGGINYTTKKNVVDLGSVELQVDQKKHIAMPPILGGVAVAVGVAFLFMGRRGAAQGRSV